MGVAQDKVRLVLNRLLVLQGGSQSVGIRQNQLAADLGVSNAVVSTAMAVLKDGGYIRQNADRSWSVSETPIYDNSGRLDVLLTEIRRLQDQIGDVTDQSRRQSRPADDVQIKALEERVEAMSQQLQDLKEQIEGWQYELHYQLREVMKAVKDLSVERCRRQSWRADLLEMEHA